MAVMLGLSSEEFIKIISVTFDIFKSPELINFYFFHKYLIIGTGKAWAWHVNDKVEPIGDLWPTVIASDENDGAFEPTGSKKDF